MKPKLLKALTTLLSINHRRSTAKTLNAQSQFQRASQLQTQIANYAHEYDAQYAQYAAQGTDPLNLHAQARFSAKLRETAQAQAPEVAFNRRQWQQAQQQLNRDTKRLDVMEDYAKRQAQAHATKAEREEQLRAEEAVQIRWAAKK